MISTLMLTLDIGNPEALERFDEAGIMRALRRGALVGGEYLRGVWVRVAQERDIRQSGEYIRANGIVKLTSERYTVTAGESGAVLEQAEFVVDVTNTAKHANIVEDGHSAFSLADAINWASAKGRIKRTKDGRPYLHIPFRHRAYASPAAAERQGLTAATLRAMMPHDVYQQAKRLTYTQRLGVGPIHNSAGQFLAADRYNWGTRLHRPGSTPRITAGSHRPFVSTFEEHRGERIVGRHADGRPMVNPAWGSSKFEGMFKSGSKGHSEYMTIRTITPTSKGWNIPAQIGHGVARRVAAMARSDSQLEAVVFGAIQDAIEGGRR